MSKRWRKGGYVWIYHECVVDVKHVDVEATCSSSSLHQYTIIARSLPPTTSEACLFIPSQLSQVTRYRPPRILLFVVTLRVA
ncbi:uncharacterized protein YALI1_E31174g [Yarrowia lipolytica]|uniref:Uncharacterized protein n=1 Tax=Yarrowia lipolytica TaxID=4952 RepID=A0A1D8NK24_YARLL|nr:hypothetical protein YALI1_E31174g [Yarrowia lipolytica]